MIRTNVEFVGAYLRDELMVVMFKFDDKMIDDFYIDYAYDPTDRIFPHGSAARWHRT